MTARRRRPKSVGPSVLVAAAAAALATADARAQSTWTNGAATANWADAANWDAGEPAASTDAILPTPIPAGGSPITLSAGRLANSLAANATYTLNGGDLTLTTGDVTVAASVTATVNSTLAGGNGFTKLGTGTLVLGAANTYTGATEVNAGTLRLGANNALPTGTALTVGAGTVAGAFDLGSFDQTVASIGFLTTAAAATNTVTIAPGKTLTVNSYKQGVTGPNVNGITTNVTFAGGGSLVVDNAAGNMDVGFRNLDQNSTGNNATLNLSALGSFSANVAELRAGYDSRIGVTLTLSNTANTITATTVQIANSLSNNGTAATVTLGTGTNAINATTINVGAGKVGGTLKFASQTAGSPGTATIAGKTAGATTDIFVGNSTATDTSSNFSALVDLRGHDVTVNAGTITLGRWARTGNAGGATGTFSFDAGTVAANAVVVGVKTNNSTGVGNGNLNVGGGSLTVGTGGFTVASQSGAGTSTGVVTITGGTVTINSDVRDGGGSATSTLTLEGGTLDMANKRIGGTAAANNIDTLNLLSGTLRNVAEINNGAPLAKTTAGLLVVSGTNAFTGGTSIADGTLRVANAGALGSATSTADVTVADAGLLHLQAAAIPDLAALRLTSTDATAEANLNYAGTDAIFSLDLNGTVFGPGVYGSTASGATSNGLIAAAGLNPDDFFTGTGTVTVTSVPEPASAGVVAVAVAGLLARRRRR